MAGDANDATRRVPEVRAALAVLMAVAEAIRDLGSVPSGVLYANLAGLLTYNHYMVCIDVLKTQGWVSESNHVLTWTGPKTLPQF